MQGVEGQAVQRPVGYDEQSPRLADGVGERREDHVVQSRQLAPGVIGQP